MSLYFLIEKIKRKVTLSFEIYKISSLKWGTQALFFGLGQLINSSYQVPENIQDCVSKSVKDTKIHVPPQ